MHGLKSFGKKEKRAVRRRNHVAKDLASGKYRQRIKPSKKQHLIDEARKRDYDFEKDIGLTSKE